MFRSPWRRLARVVLDHPVLAVLAVVLLLGVSAAGLPGLRPDLDLRAFLPDEGRARLHAYESRWGRDDQAVLVALQAPSSDGWLTPPALERLESLRAELAAIPGVDAATALTSAPLLRTAHPFRRDPAVLAPLDLVQAVPDHDAPHAAAWRARILASPLRSPAWISTDAQTTAILVRLASEDVPGQEAALHAVQERVQRTGLTGGVTGGPAIAAAIRAQLLAENRWIAPTTLIVLLLLLAASARTFRGWLLPLLVAVGSLVALAGGVGWLGRPFTPLSQAWVSLLPAVAIADCLHLLRRVGELQEGGASRREAVLDGMQTVAPACAITSLTTAGGLLSLSFGSLPLVRGFAVEAAVGVCLAFLLFLILGPLLAVGAPPGRLERSLGSLAATIGLAARSRRVAVWSAAVVLAVGCGLLAWGVPVDQRFAQALQPQDPVRLAADRVEASLGGTQAVSLELSAAPGVLARPQVVQAVLDLTAHRPAISYAHAVNEALVALRGPNTDTRGSQAVIEHLGPERLGLVDGRTRVIVRAPDQGARALLTLAEELEDEARLHLEPLGVQVEAQGASVQVARGVLGTSSDLALSLVLAVLSVGLLLGLVLRRLWAVALTLGATALPLLVAAALLRILDWPLQAGLAVVFTLGLGLAVDDTVHLLTRWREERARGSGALERALHGTGSALVLTTAALAGTFGVSACSRLPGIAEVGLLASVLLVGALAATLILVPTALSDPQAGPRGPAASTGSIGPANPDPSQRSRLDPAREAP